MDMNVFFSIPHVQQLELLNHWLCVDDVVALDSATCNRQIRPELLAVLASRECVLNRFDCPEEADSWVLRRNIKFYELDLEYEFLNNNERRDRFLRYYGPHIKSLCICMGAMDDNGDELDPLPMDIIFYEVSQYCPFLRRLFMNVGIPEGSLALLIAHSKHLRELIFESCYDISSGILKAICSSSSLQTLVFKFYTSFSNNAFQFVASGCPTLTKLGIHEVDITSDQLAQLTKYMPNLKHVRVKVD